jgi:acyl carrier protein
MDDVSEGVLELIATELKIPRAALKTDVPLHDLDIDSIRLLELGMDIEDRFKIVIADEAFATFRTLDDLVAFIRANHPVASGQAAAPLA